MKTFERRKFIKSLDYKENGSRSWDDGHMHFEKYSQLYLFGIRIGRPKFLKSISEKIIYNQTSNLDKFGNFFILAIGNKVMCKSDLDEKYKIAHITRFEDFNGKVAGNAKAVPVVKYVNCVDESATFEIVIPYHEEIEKILNALEPIEQWNFLCRDHCQVKERSEIRYQTFEIGSTSSIMQWYENNSKRLLGDNFVESNNLNLKII